MEKPKGQKSEKSVHYPCYKDAYSATQYPKGIPRRCLGQNLECARLVWCGSCRVCRDESWFQQDPPGYFKTRSCNQCENKKKETKMKKASEDEDTAEQASSSQAYFSQSAPTQPDQLVRLIPPPTQQQLSSLHASDSYQQAFGHVQSNLGFMYNQEAFGLPPPPTPHPEPTTGPSQQIPGHAQSTPILPANIGFMSTQHSIGRNQPPAGYSEQSTCPPLEYLAGYG
ncbi:hypothetical protein BDP81DRAFT_451381 [Colletotrichum phormii]|uniref:Uncharacterized protein n=1 Tax=Colletotrichum phormii TaxID=359342 RepID=A0AAI9ZPZ5_9PEZI|nr:uncharacterized protein BDP81DRAFT_451381 [Colletotrichum phormii]KAK1634908.1 hypothetical protein BDP81DRAFT_451381 [Colletotrichum phormii]